MTGVRTGPGWDDPSTISTGRFIFEYLSEHKDGYAQEIWRQLKIAREQSVRVHKPGERKRGKRAVTSYSNFLCNYWEPLIKMKMIVYSRRVAGTAGPANKPWACRYYKLPPGTEFDPRWNNIQKAYNQFKGWAQEGYD